MVKIDNLVLRVNKASNKLSDLKSDPRLVTLDLERQRIVKIKKFVF